MGEGTILRASHRSTLRRFPDYSAVSLPLATPQIVAEGIKSLRARSFSLQQIAAARIGRGLMLTALTVERRTDC